jgi:cytochrome c-type biogenesis protein CcmE
MTETNHENGSIEIRSSNPAGRNAAAIVIIVVALVGFIWFGMKSETYAKTVNEVLAEGAELKGKSVRVEGKILDRIRFSDDRSIIYFQLEDMNDPGPELRIEYAGPPPDGFQEGYTAIVTGRVEGPDLIKANMLMCKCPSRDEAAAETATEEEAREHREMHKEKADEYQAKAGGA